MKSGNSFYQTDYHTWVTFILGISIKHVNRLSATSRESFRKTKKGTKGDTRNSNSEQKKIHLIIPAG